MAYQNNMIHCFGPFTNLIKNHYNDTNYFLRYNVDNNEFAVTPYTTPVSEIVFFDAITVGILFYILNNL